MGLCELLTIVFVVLKCCGHIDWSWWLVFLPEIIAAVFYVALVIMNVIMQVRADRKFIKRLSERY